MIIRHLLDKGKGPVLAVDADANSNLNEVLGVKLRSTIGEAREVMKKDVPVGMTKDIWFEYRIQEALVETVGIVAGREKKPKTQKSDDWSNIKAVLDLYHEIGDVSGG